MDTNTATSRLLLGNSIKEIQTIDDSSVHLILSDIPYGISFSDWDVLHSNTNSALGGASPAQLSGNSGFKSRGKPINGWSDADRRIPREYQEWCSSWAEEWYRVLKPGASCIIFAGRRFAHRATVALEDAGFNLRDVLAWKKDRAALKAQAISKVYGRRGDTESAERFSDWRVGNLRPTFEPILWFVKPYKQGGTIADNMLQHGVGAYNLSAWQQYTADGSNNIESKSVKSDHGLHPAQKPLGLMKALIELTTLEDQIVLDPFMGSGTVPVAAAELNRRYIGIEFVQEYFETAVARLENIDSTKNEAIRQGQNSDPMKLF